MGEGTPGERDEDRQAILARRRRFITLALVGLTSSCGRAREPSSAGPRDAAEADPRKAADTEESETEGAHGVDPIDRPPPREPKKYAKPRRNWKGRARGQPCLRVALPEEDAP